MKLTVLGNYGPYPWNGGNCSGYLLTAGGTNLVLDMGSGVLRNLDRVCSVCDIGAVFLSHLHFDHTGDMLPLSYRKFADGKKLKVFVHAEDTDYCRVLLNGDVFEIINIDENSAPVLGGCALSFEKMEHPEADYAIKVRAEGKTLVYSGDTVMNDRLVPFVRDADAVLLDCAKPASFAGPHMNIAEAARIYDETGVRIIATHFTPGETPETYENVRPGISVTREMTVIEI